MNKHDSLKILALISANYPQLKDRDAVEGIANLWSMIFADKTPNDVYKAVMEHLQDAEKGMYLPNVADITKRLPTNQKLLTSRPENAATKLRDYRKPIDKAYRAKGLYPYHEARVHGISSEEWERMAKGV